MQNKLKLLDASVRHLGTDINYVVLENMYAHLKDKVDFYFDTPVESVEVLYDENTAGLMLAVYKRLTQTMYPDMQ